MFQLNGELQVHTSLERPTLFLSKSREYRTEDRLVS